MRRPLFGRDSGLSTVNTAKCYAGCDSHRRPVRRTTPRRKCRCGASVSVPLAGASLGDAPPISPIVRIPRQELIATHLRRRILRGEIAAGDTLPPEVELMAQFGVSRSTLRETFRILETESLISVWRVPGRSAGDFARVVGRCAGEGPVGRNFAPVGAEPAVGGRLHVRLDAGRLGVSRVCHRLCPTHSRLESVDVDDHRPGHRRDQPGNFHTEPGR